MALWAPVLHATETGIEMRNLSDAFVGRHIIPRHRGYMQSQAQRLLGARGRGHGRRGGGGRGELLDVHGYDTKYAMHCSRLGFQGIELLTTGRLDLPIQGEPAEWLRAVRQGEVEFDAWWTRTLDLDTTLGTLAADDSIPPTADRTRIQEWSVRTHLAHWSAT